MFSVKTLNKKEGSCLLFIYHENNSLVFRAVDDESNYVCLAPPSPCSCYVLPPNGIRDFIKNIPEMFGKTLKAAILQIFGLNVMPGFKDNDELCNAFKTRFDGLKIPYCFLTREQERFSTMIAAADLNIRPTEKIMAVSIYGTYLMNSIIECSKNGNFMHNVKVEMTPETILTVFEDLIKKFQPKNILMCQEDESSNQLFQLLKIFFGRFGNLLALEEDFIEYTKNFVVETGKWMFDKKSCKYYVHPKTSLTYEIRDSFDKVLISIDPSENLPLKKTCVVSKFVTSVKEQKEDAKPKIHMIDHKFHRTSIAVTVDENFFYKLEILPVMLPKIGASLLSSLNATSKSKNPVIGFCDNFSVICIWNEAENEYQFVESWNGINGTELVIDFAEEKPVCCQKKSFEKVKSSTESKYVVYDLIKIMSMESDVVKAEKRWGFKITEDEKNPVLLEMNTFEGTKYSSPAFLMALLIKEHRKIIKDEIGGEKPEKLGFCILDEGYGIEEKDRIQNGLKEACDLLKVDAEFLNI